MEKDERENRHRMILNFGHTLGHAIEALTGYTAYKHGEAVAIGMVYAAKLSKETGRCSDEVCRRLAALVEKFGLPSRLPNLAAGKIIEAMYLDKKTSDKKIRYVLAKAIGSVEIADRVSETVLRKVLENTA